ncbi:MAG: hypothetical protein Kow0069_35650 [Promethearchaeota archaeon]
MEPEVLVYRIGPGGDLKGVPEALLVEEFSPINVLLFFVPASRKLYVWRGNRINPIAQRYLQDAKELLKKEAPEASILRTVVVDFGDEPDSFFRDVGVDPERVRGRLSAVQKKFESEIFEKVQELRREQLELVEKKMYDDSVRVARKIIELAVELNDEGLQEEQREFIRDVLGVKEDEELLEAKRGEFLAQLSRVTELLDAGDVAGAHEAVKVIKIQWDDFPSLLGDEQAREVFVRTSRAWEEQKRQEATNQAKVAEVAAAIDRKVDEGDLEGAKRSVEELEAALSACADEGFVESWKSRVGAARRRVESESAALSRAEQLRREVEGALDDGDLESARELTAELVDAVDRLTCTKYKEQFDAFVEQAIERVNRPATEAATSLERAKEELQTALDEAEAEFATWSLGESTAPLEMVVEKLQSTAAAARRVLSEASQAPGVEGLGPLVDQLQDLLSRQDELVERLGATGRAAKLNDEALEALALGNLTEARELVQEMLQLSGRFDVRAVDAKARSLLAEVERAELRRQVEAAVEQANQRTAAGNLQGAEAALALAAEKLGDLPASLGDASELEAAVAKARSDLEEAKRRRREAAVEDLRSLEKKVSVDREAGRWRACVLNCERAVELARTAELTEEVTRFQAVLDEAKSKLAELERLEAEELKALRKAAEQLADLTDFEPDVLPVVENYSVEDLLGDVSGEIDELARKLATFLDGHRVEVKEEATSSVLLRGPRGEAVEVERTTKVESPPAGDGGSPPDASRAVLRTGFENPFDDPLEEAVLSDVIPYNFEVVEVELEGPVEPVTPERVPKKEGLEVRWTVRGVPAKQRVDVTYDLRRRVSRTIVVTMDEDLRVVKTHSSLKPTPSSDCYQASLRYTNLPDDATMVVVEDVLPPKHVHEVARPEVPPADVKESPLGALVRWDFPRVPAGETTRHDYAFWDAARFESMKAKALGALKRSRKMAKAGDLEGASAPLSEVVTFLGETLANGGIEHERVAGGDQASASEERPTSEAVGFVEALNHLDAARESVAGAHSPATLHRTLVLALDRVRSAAAKEKAAQEAESEAKEAAKRAAEAELEAKRHQFDRAEEIFQAKMADKCYEAALAMAPKLLELARDLGLTDKVARYEALERELREQLSRQQELERLYQEKLATMEKLKLSAARLEERLKFDDAATKYREIGELAGEIGDGLSLAFVKERLEKIEAWKQELLSSEHARWEISPFKIINRLRYELVDVYPDEARAAARANELVESGVPEGNVKVVVVVRSKFKGTGPYDDRGRCHVVYVRETRDSEDAPM